MSILDPKKHCITEMSFSDTSHERLHEIELCRQACLLAALRSLKALHLCVSHSFVDLWLMSAYLFPSAHVVPGAAQARVESKNNKL